MTSTRVERATIGRLRRRAEFLAAAKGVRIGSALFTVQVNPRRDDAGARVGLTVTRKVGHAVERNRIRRRLRAAVQDCFAGTAAAQGAVDYVFVARRAVLEADYASLVGEMSAALRRAPAKLLKVRGAAPEHGNG